MRFWILNPFAGQATFFSPKALIGRATFLSFYAKGLTHIRKKNQHKEKKRRKKERHTKLLINSKFLFCLKIKNKKINKNK